MCRRQVPAEPSVNMSFNQEEQALGRNLRGCPIMPPSTCLPRPSASWHGGCRLTAALMLEPTPMGVLLLLDKWSNVLPRDSMFMGTSGFSRCREYLGRLVGNADPVAVVAVVSRDVEQCEKVSVLVDAVE